MTALCTAPSIGGGLRYVLADVQGSSRAVMNNNGAGTSAVIARRDYLPFGEEIGSGLGLRTSSQGYNAIDNSRQKFALTERDSITGLDHTWFRKYESLAGRWTSPDPLVGSIANPQSFNRYNYVNNDPVNFVDPTGLECWNITIEGVTYRICPSEAVQVYWNDRSLDLPGAGTRDWDRPLLFPIGNPESPGPGPRLDPGQVRDTQRRIADGKAWDKWVAWLTCHTPIMNKHNARIKEYLKIGGEAFKMEAQVVAGAFLGFFGAGTGRVGGNVGTGQEGDWQEGGPVFAGWVAALAVIGVHMKERRVINEIKADYEKESTAACGPKPPRP